MTTRKDPEDLSGAYALDAVDAAERARFEAHLAESEDLRTEATELADTAVQLGLAVEPEAPPASLKAGIMARIAELPQQAADAPAELNPAGAAARASADPTVTTSAGPAERTARDRWFRRPAAMLAAAAAAVVILVGGGVLANSVTQNVMQQAQADQLAAINAADDVQRTVADIEGGGTATLVWSGELASSALIVDGLGALPSDRVYELWYIDEEDGARPAGTFSVGENGATWRVLDGEMTADDAVGVTIEPNGGSPEPTTDPIVVLATA